MDAAAASNSNSNNNSNSNAPGGGQKDLSSVLTHIESLQKQLAEKTAELSEVRQREENAKNQVAQLNDLNAKLTEAKREAMREEFNNKVRGWIQSLDSKQVPDVVKEEFLSGAERFVDKGNETGAWKVLCSASAVHQNQVNTIQKLTEDYNALKKTLDGGQFATEDSRKRKEMEPSTTVSQPYGVWEQLEGICSKY